MPCVLGPLTMVYACGAWWKKASDILRGGMVVDALIEAHSKSALHKFVARPQGGTIRLGATESLCAGMYSPANIVTVRRNRVALKDIL